MIPVYSRCPEGECEYEWWCPHRDDPAEAESAPEDFVEAEPPRALIGQQSPEPIPVDRCDFGR